MPLPGSPHGFRAILLVLAWAQLLPGAAAGQQPTSVPIPSLEDLDAERTHDLALLEELSLAVAVPPNSSRLAPVHTPVLALTGSPEDVRDDAREGLGSLGDVLPRELYRDLVALRDRVLRYRTVLFGNRGILRWGDLEGDDRIGRVRLNLQADPRPGLRVTLMTR